MQKSKGLFCTEKKVLNTDLKIFDVPIQIRLRFGMAISIKAHLSLKIHFT